MEDDALDVGSPSRHNRRPEEQAPVKRDKNGKKIKLSYFRTRTETVLFYTAAVTDLLAACTIPGFMYLFGKFADSFADPDSSYGTWLFAMASMAVLDFIFSAIGETAIELSAERQMRHLREDFLNEVMKQEMGFFDQFDATTLATQLSFHCVSIRDAIGHQLGVYVLYVSLAVACLAYGFYANWQMTIFGLCTLPFIVAAGLWATRVDLRVSQNSSQAFEDAASTAQETFVSLKTVKAFTLEPVMTSRFISAIKYAYTVGTAGGRKIGLALGLHWLAMFMSFAIGFLWGVHVVVKGMKKNPELCWPNYNGNGWPSSAECFSGGQAIGVFNCVVTAGYFLSKIGPYLTIRKKATRAIAEVVDLYSRDSLIDPFITKGIADRSNFEGQIEFKNVEFSYPASSGRKVFQSLSLTIPAGKSVALVGASGCGKSTIIQLVERFYDCTSGSLTVDGMPIKDYRVSWLREQMALVSQEPRLFADTILRNIAVGRTGASREEVIAAAKDANAHNFIMQFPDNYDTFVGEGGGQLSGGQKQRIAIARAILRSPKILILDEATSALDNESEKIVQDTLNRIVANSSRTTIIVAHRLSTIREADVIIVLDNPDGTGAVVAEQGTHDELKKIPDGLYAALVAAQMGSDDAVAQLQDEYSQSLRTSADLASQYSADLPGKQQSIVKLTSKFSTVHENKETDRRSSSVLFDLQHAQTIKRERLYRRTIEPLMTMRLKLLLGCIGGCLNGAVWPLFAIAYSFLIMAFIEESPSAVWREARKQWAWFPCLGLLALGGLYLQTSMMEVCGQAVIRGIRTRLFQAILRQDVSFFDLPQHSPGSLMGLLSGDAQAMRGWGGDNFGVYCQCGTAILIAVILGLAANWKLGLVAIASVSVFVPIAFLQARLQRSKKPKETADATEQPTGAVTADELDPQSIIHEVVLNIRTITAFGIQPVMSERFREVVRREYARGKPKAYMAGVLWGLSQSLLLIIITANMYYGVQLILDDELGARQMLQCVFALVFAAANIGKAFATATGAARAREAAHRIYAVIDSKPIIDDQSANGKAIDSVDSIEFERVAFLYPSRPDQTVYRDVSFSIPRGKVTALVGASGCGKSTAVQLLERFYDVYESSDTADGQVTINDNDIRDYNVRSLRQCIGLVSQEPVLFWGSVEENIAYGKIDAGANDVVEAAKQANAHEFISNLPQGYQSDVGRGGSKLSGGQKQRVAIARALIRHPKVLILDEATSALDAESERIVQAALDALLESKQHTTLIIAHRLSTIRRADQIVVFLNPDGHGSRIAEVGTHEELMKIKGGIYRGLVRIAEQR